MRPSDIPAFSIMALGLLCIFLLYVIKMLNAAIFLVLGFTCMAMGLRHFVDDHLMPFCNDAEDGIISHIDWVKAQIDRGVDFFTR